MIKQAVIQDRILLGILQDFEKSFGIKETESKKFEKLVNYIIFSKIDPDAFDDSAIFSSIDVDKTSTFGIDAFGIFINGKLIQSVEQISEMRQSGRMDVKFVFIQTKRSVDLDTGELLKFSTAVSNFLSPAPLIPLSDELKEARKLFDEIYKRDNARLFKGLKPSCDLFFATTGAECKNDFVLSLLESEKQKIQNENPDVKCEKFEHIHKDYIIDGFNEIENTYQALIQFKNCVTCEPISDVDQAYIGFLPVSEFLKIITGTRDGLLLKNIFYENVRDFQGESNTVNSEIANTLKNANEHDKFILLNNGITIVAKIFQNIRSSNYEISNYFIVNGCQTSTTIYSHKDILLDSKLQVPVKIIHTQNEELISKVIRSTNRQTPVPDEAFVSLEKFHKRLQQFYKTFASEAPHALYYERRSREFSGNSLIEKFRIVNLHAQIRTFSAIILNEPYLQCTKNPSSILKLLKDNLFKEDHKYITYYLSSLLLFIFYRLRDDDKIDRKYEISRYWICWIARIIALNGRIDIGPINSHQLEKEISIFVANLGDDFYSVALFVKATEVFDAVKNIQPRTNGFPPRSRDLIKNKTFRDDIKKHISRNRIVFPYTKK